MNDFRLLFHCYILISRKCPRKTPFKTQWEGGGTCNVGAKNRGMRSKRGAKIFGAYAPLASPLSTSLRLALATLWYTSLKLTRSVIKLMPAYSLGWISNPRRYQCIASFSISLLLYSDSTNLSLQIRPHRQRLSGTSFSFVFKDFVIIS